MHYKGRISIINLILVMIFLITMSIICALPPAKICHLESMFGQTRMIESAERC